jgi:multidrug efflux pump subunit AcrB
VAATLSFLALFVPFLIVPGLTSLLFRELILVIAGIVVIRLVVAVSVTPIPKAMRDISTEDYVARLRKVVGKLQPLAGKRW